MIASNLKQVLASENYECEDLYDRLNVVTTFLRAVDYELFAQAIQLALGNQVKAAKWLGISRPTLCEKLVLYGLFTPMPRADRFRAVTRNFPT